MDNEILQGKIRKLKNLPAFKNKTDAELEDYVKNIIPKKKERAVKEAAKKEASPQKEYERKYNQKLTQLKDEYGIDMNDSNDAENLRIYVRLSIQLEDINTQIRELTGKPGVWDDTKALKDLGDYQKSLVASVTDLQDKLGITRKVRKERQVDDIPQYLKGIRHKANAFWERSTTPIRCENCSIELARYWLNFPKLASKTSFELECWKCHDRVVFVR